jgi:hypothetical protein
VVLPVLRALHRGWQRLGSVIGATPRGTTPRGTTPREAWMPSAAPLVRDIGAPRMYRAVMAAVDMWGAIDAALACAR